MTYSVRKRFWVVLVGVLLISLFYKQTTQSSAAVSVRKPAKKPTASTQSVKTAPKVTPAPSPKPTTTATPAPIVQTPAITTVFWAGEGATVDNGHISNAASAWDEDWANNFGGIDDPVNRNGFYPAAFTPKENPFYFALPYNDFSEVYTRKLTAKHCPNAKKSGLEHHSWCKNSWIEITAKGQTVYAQWQDVGPYQEDDVNYVFGTALPLNKIDSKAGLDVSPAVRDYLKLQDVDKASWKFIEAEKVPDGPWKNIVTTSLGNSLD